MHLAPEDVRTDLIRSGKIAALVELRDDTLVQAQPKTICKLGPLEQRWSYASWTAPSHYNLLSGLLPHSSPSQVFASEYYKKDFLKFAERLDIDIVL